MNFVRPGEGSRSRRCGATIDGHIQCEQAPDHGGRHSNGLLVWHEPPLILIDGQPPDVTTETDHWARGNVLFSHEEPPL